MTLTRSLLNCFVILLAPVPALTPICHAEDIPDYEANIVPFLHGSTGIGFGEFFCGRNVENGTPIDASGQLMSCEAFNDVPELHRGVREHRSSDFYRCLTQKMLILATGRGLEYSDEQSNFGET